MSDEDDDYMTMILPDSTTTTPASSIARTAAAKRESAARGRPKSKRELASEREKATQASLSTSLDPSNKGAKMLARLGYSGGALGAKDNPNARTTPIAVNIKDDRGGVGMESEKKRKIREELGREAERLKMRKVEQDDFLERVRVESKEKHTEGCWWGAMKVAERLDEERKEDEGENGPGKELIYRPLQRQRVDVEREGRLRREAQARLDRLPEVEDREEDDDDRVAMEREVEEVEEHEDVELDEYMALEPAERLAKVVEYLRERFRYCFWCKYRYPDGEMEGCPGVTEEDHD